jgi:hypothetical protein
LTHASELAVAGEVRPEVEAIEQNRSLIKDPDPVPGLLERLTEALRNAITEVHGECTKRHEAGLALLEGSSAWQKLTPEQRYELLTRHGVHEVPAVEVGSTDEVYTRFSE